MELSRTIALVALFLVVFTLFASGRALGQDDKRAHGRQLAALAAEEAELQQLETYQARRAAAERQAKAALLRRKALERRCVIKPVMSDAEIDGCRVVYSM